MLRIPILLVLTCAALSSACVGGDDDDGTTPEAAGTASQERGATPGSGGALLMPDCARALPWDQAAEYAGTDQAVAGPVTGIRDESIGDDAYRVIAIGAPAGEPRGMDVFIPETRLGRFGATIEETFAAGETLCAIGTITVADERLRIFVSGPDELATIPPGAPDPAAPGGECDVPLPWEQAVSQAGETVPVAGPVVGYREETAEDDEFFVIEVGRPAPEDGGVDIAIPAYALDNFGEHPRDLYDVGETICVEGAIVNAGGRARIVAQLPEGIFVRPAPAAEPDAP
ncbi:MAG TPA: hypothetical protein VNM91_03140 [Dehalococcoidia bacterium]|nr:hypothetical protein [Dehalococcoidia bacterium]